jgi:flavin-dependent dehydrogenase
MKHVILGAGPAGVIAAETLRKHAPADEIVLDRRRARGALFAHGHPLPADGQHRRAGTHLRQPATTSKRLRITLLRGRAAVDCAAQRSRSTTAARSATTAC